MKHYSKVPIASDRKQVSDQPTHLSHQSENLPQIKLSREDYHFFSRTYVNSYYSASIQRTAAENFIRNVYQQHFRANISDFYPHLLTLEENSQGPHPKNFYAIAGLRCADQQPLFAEHYLSQPIEVLLSQSNRSFSSYIKALERNSIMEIGNLAITERKPLRWLISALILYLYAADFQYAVFTAIPVIANSFKRLGLPICELAQANREQLPTHLQNQWGADYYALKPKVYSLQISPAHEQLSQNLHSLNPHIQAFFHKSYELGNRHYKVAQVA